MPALAAVALPWRGATFTVQISNLPPGNPAVLWFGASATSWGAVSLPLPLGFAGLPGCQLLTGLDLTVPLALSAGSASLTLPLASSLPVGAAFYNQGAVLDPSLNPAGLALSNGAIGRIGSK